MSFFLRIFGGPACGGGNFFGFPTWYKYLPSVDQSDPCVPQISGINDVWLIVAAIIEMLLRVAAMAAVGFIIYGGVMYIISQGEPDKIARAKSTLLNAIIGLIIAVSSTAVITFIAGSIN